MNDKPIDLELLERELGGKWTHKTHWLDIATNGVIALTKLSMDWVASRDDRRHSWSEWADTPQGAINNLCDDLALEKARIMAKALNEVAAIDKVLAFERVENNQ